ncbi:MAG: hypothetical protein ABI867_16425 [Kofleriaceae bacterium]
MRVLGLLALTLALPFGCGSDTPDAQVSGVFPSSAFLGRQLRVEVSGDVTEWSDAAKVDFGPGITVDSVAVASPSALFAEITIAEDADPGLRTVTVTDGGDTVTLDEAFSLEPAIEIEFIGTVAQGSIAAFTIKNRDPFAPFDTTSVGDGFFEPLVFTNIQVQAGAGVSLQVGSVDAFAISGTALFNTDAAAGRLVVFSGPSDAQDVSPLGAELAVEARTAQVITSGTPAMGNVAGPLASSLYEFTPADGAALIQLTSSSTSQTASPRFALLGPSGSFDDLISFSAAEAIIQESGAAEKFYLVYWDNSGANGYTYQLNARSTALTSTPDVEPNNTVATASPITVPALVTAASLEDIDDADFLTFQAVAGDIGKKVHVVTGGSDPFTDTVVEVFAGTNCNTLLGVASNDLDFHENHLSAAITAAGKICVKVTASSAFDEADKNYVAAVTLE